MIVRRALKHAHVVAGGGAIDMEVRRSCNAAERIAISSYAHRVDSIVWCFHGRVHTAARQAKAVRSKRKGFTCHSLALQARFVSPWVHAWEMLCSNPVASRWVYVCCLLVLSHAIPPPFLPAPPSFQLSRALRDHARSIPGKSQLFINAFAKALEVSQDGPAEGLY